MRPPPRKVPVGDVRTGFARTDDGVDLYWRSVGSGPPLVCSNGVGVSTFFWKYVVEHFRERYQVVLWDYRGHGLSSVPVDVDAADLSIERAARDLAQVLDVIGVDAPAVHLGHSMGCQVILQLCQLFPSRVRALVPMFGTYGRALDTFMDNPASRPMFDVVHRLARAAGRPGLRLLRPLYASPLAFAVGRRAGLVDRYYCGRRDVEMYLDHLNHMDARVFLRMVEAMADHDLTEFLPSVHVPTLVIAAENDLFTPLHRSRRMAELIPGAEILVLAEGSHAAIVEHPETINLRIDRFLAERVEQDLAAGSAQGA